MCRSVFNPPNKDLCSPILFRTMYLPTICKNYWNLGGGYISFYVGRNLGILVLLRNPRMCVNKLLRTALRKRREEGTQHYIQRFYLICTGHLALSMKVHSSDRTEFCSEFVKGETVWERRGPWKVSTKIKVGEKETGNKIMIFTEHDRLRAK
jgi:hypothetical protein